MTRHRSPPPAIIRCLLVRPMLHPQSCAPSPSVLPGSQSLAPVSPAPSGRGHSVISRRPHRLTRAVLSRAPSFLPVRLPFFVCSPSARRPSRALFPFTPSMPFRAVCAASHRAARAFSPRARSLRAITPLSRAPCGRRPPSGPPSRPLAWRTLAVVWCPVAFYYAPLCPLGPLTTPRAARHCLAALVRHSTSSGPPLYRVPPSRALSRPTAASLPVAPRRALSRPLPPRGAPASHSCATPRRLDLRAASSRRLAAPPSMSAPVCRITVPCAVAMVPAARQLATPRAFSLAADLRSGGPTGCVAAAHALAMAQAACPLAVPLALSPVYPSPTVSCRAGPSNGAGGTLSRHPTLESRHQHTLSSCRVP
ncbi:hypothetical protein DENSPDRAFT_885051 [Dentipellis sp. KUC8613]|nr:hypothetical protein DENSPDRAFT_885051 [Dentipellis sp. KUC8613]